MLAFFVQPRRSRRQARRQTHQFLEDPCARGLARLLERASWDSDRIETLEALYEGRRMNVTSRTLVDVMKTFDWDSGRVEAAKFFRIINPEGMAYVVDTLTFSSSRREFISALRS